jgi:hypothetical protein
VETGALYALSPANMAALIASMLNGELDEFVRQVQRWHDCNRFHGLDLLLSSAA